MTEVKLHHVQHGEGVPLLAVHGWTPDHRLMSGCLEPVFANRPGYRRVYPDLPGMGGSPAPESIASSDDVLACLDAFIDEQFGTEPMLLVGESYGGYLARALANRRAEQVRGLALICPIGRALWHAERTVPEHRVISAESGLLADVDPAVADGFSSMSVVQNEQTLRRYRENIAPGLAVADEVAMDRIQRRWELSTDPESGDPYPHPALILTGRQDSVTGYADSYPLLDHYPRASFAILDRAGHNLQDEQPALFEALIAEWLDRAAEAWAH
ncbi:MAG: alpha/beta fold hydrolase [Stackebrandtia sp.]